ncbi:CAP domain-containing protein [Streptomyces sp. NPDC096012]|uniref:CAP domain-containing protein n=1 Tax=Streptomyces sp. NPDC096012 TaxID=3155684 RepID=UPI00336A960B
MGRHRRSAAGRAATDHATGATHPHGPAAAGDGPQSSSAGRPVPRGIAPYLNPEAYAEANAKAQAYLFAQGAGPGAPGADGTTPAASAAGGSAPSPFSASPSAGHQHRKKMGRPVRSGLLGVSAAVALSSLAAVATGVMPGLEHYQLGGSTNTTGGDSVQAAGSPSNTASEQGGTSGSADATPGAPAGNPARPQSPSRTAPASTTPSAPASPSASASASKQPSPVPTPSKTAGRRTAPRATPSTPRTTPSRRTAAPAAPTVPSKAPTASASPAPGTVTNEAVAEAEVLKLVNEERAKVGCSALAANSSLTRLAEAFSADMAARGFFDHTDPDGASPWDRAAKASITDLGGENIARGQATAAAVMEAWMNSPGHRANILNCDFKTLGVGAHFGPGGPWWTQDFGY